MEPVSLAGIERALVVMAHPDDYPLPPREGPTREELLDALSTKEAANA